MSSSSSNGGSNITTSTTTTTTTDDQLFGTDNVELKLTLGDNERQLQIAVWRETLGNSWPSLYITH